MHEIAELLLRADDARRQANSKRVGADRRAELERLAQEWEMRAVCQLLGSEQSPKPPPRNLN